MMETTTTMVVVVAALVVVAPLPTRLDAARIVFLDSSVVSLLAGHQHAVYCVLD